MQMPLLNPFAVKLKLYRDIVTISNSQGGKNLTRIVSEKVMRENSRRMLSFRSNMCIAPNFVWVVSQLETA